MARRLALASFPPTVNEKEPCLQRSQGTSRGSPYTQRCGSRADPTGKAPPGRWMPLYHSRSKEGFLCPATAQLRRSH